MERFVSSSLVAAALLLGAMACGGNSQSGSQMMTGPPSTAVSSGTVLAAVVPAGNAVSVSTSAAIVMRFNHAMAAGMERYMDLHEGDTSGPTVPLSCGWSSDRTTLTCQPQAPLKPQTRYAIHMGDGMMDTDNRPVGMDPGLLLGGQWLMAGMMGGMHAGSPMGMMSSGWMGSNGSYGMVFAFTTA
jgi:hypothetical protein